MQCLRRPMCVQSFQKPVLPGNVKLLAGRVSPPLVVKPARFAQLQRRPVSVLAGKVAAIKAAVQTSAHDASNAAAAAASSVGSMGLESLAVTLASVYCVVLISMMLLLPRARTTQKLMANQWVFLPLTVLYGVLLVRSWSPDMMSILMPGSLAAGFSGGFNPQFFPSFDGIQSLFSRPATASSLLVHILTINLFLCRFIYQDGWRRKLPTSVSLLLASVFGPLGLLAHLAMQAVFRLFPSLAVMAHRRDVPLVERSGDGFLTVMPYS